MSPAKRIFLNIVATYSRSLYSLIIALFCGRWTLMALGSVDYGLIGVVGCLTGFISFINSLLGAAVGRFYAFSVGAEHKDGNAEAGLDECRRWFNAAITIHTILPTILMAIGYPIGAWAVKHYLTIPLERVADCVWVWRFTCLTCLVGMMSIPFKSMYEAKQEIAELTIYSFVTTTLNVVVMYYMVSHPAVWLVPYMGWVALQILVPELIIAIRAMIKYSECTVVPRYLWDIRRFIELSKYGFAKVWSDLATMISWQGKALLVNKYMGPSYNASMTVGSSLASKANALAASLSAAFWPAITNKAGEEKIDDMRRMSFLTCRFGATLVLFFAIPLSLEIKELLRLWLVNPPPFTAEVCVTVLATSVLVKMTDGYSMAILGMGRGILKYSWITGLAGISLVIIAGVLFACGFGMWSIILAMLVSDVLVLIARVFLGNSLVALEWRYWVQRVLLPVLITVIITVGVASCVMIIMPPSIVRIICTSAVAELVFIPLSWMLVVEKDEKAFLITKMRSRFNWCRGS